DGAPVVADVEVLALPVEGRTALAVVRADPQHLLVGEQDGGDGVLGDRKCVGPGGGRDLDATLPAGVGDVVLDRSGGVNDGTQPGRGSEHRLVHRRAAPAADDHFGLAQGGAGLGCGEVVEDEGGVDVGEPDDPGQGAAVDQLAGELRMHGQ